MKKKLLPKPLPMPLSSFFVAITFILLLVFSTSVFAEGTKTKIYQIATIDLEKVLALVSEDEDFKTSLDNYQNTLSSNAQEIQDKVSEMQGLLQDNPDLSTEKKREILNDIAFQKGLLKSLVVNPSANENSKVFAVLYEVIRKVAKSRGFSMVIEKRTAVIYASDEVDLTEEVIRRIRTSFR